jgi:hypothetical protein
LDSLDRLHLENIQPPDIFTALDSLKMSQNPVVTAGLDIGIEAEFLLTGRNGGDNDAPNLKYFAYAIAASYNEDAPDWVPKMRQEVEIDDVYDKEDPRKYHDWVLTADKSLEETLNPNDEDSGPRKCNCPCQMR